MSASARAGVASLLAASLAAGLPGHSPAAARLPAGSSAPPLGAPARWSGARARVPSAIVAPDSSGGDLRALEGRPIRTIQIAARNIFEPLPHGRLRGLYWMADALHVRTREFTIRNLLLLQVGDRWTAERAAEAIRRLRELDFLIPERLEAHLVRDSVDVVVRTIDTWTTSPQLDVQSSGGTRTGSIAFAEGNVLGLGKSISATYRKEPTGVSRSIEWNDPGMFGTHVRADFMSSWGTSSASHVDVGIPFYAPLSPAAAFGDWQNVRGVAQLYAGGVDAAELDVRRMETDVMVGRGIERKDGTVIRWIGSFHVRDRQLGPSRLLAPGPTAFVGAAEDLRLRRVAIETQWWRPDFIERTGINRMTRIEDFDVGPRVTLKLGIAPKPFGSTATEGYLRAAVDAGFAKEQVFGLLHATLETRYRRAVREEIQTIEARWVAPLAAHQALVVAGLRIAGIDVARDFQLTAGGLSGLRAYPIHELSGREMLRMNVEDRWTGPEFWQLMSIGAAAFYDGAHMAGAGAEGSPWHHDAGLGLRLSFSRSALNQVLRFDVAIPIDPARDGGHAPVYSFGSSQAF